MLTKLEQRIEQWSSDPNEIQGSIDAAVLLQAHLDTAKTNSTEVVEINLDSSQLIPDKDPIQLSDDLKLETFAALKKQLGIHIK